MPIESPTDEGMQKQVVAALDRIGRVSREYERAGKALPIPKSIEKSFFHINEMQKQHQMQAMNNQILTHTQTQLQALRDISVWLIEKHHELRGTPVPDRSTWENF